MTPFGIKQRSSENTHPLVSVIIPTYNRSDLVCEAIDSVLAQDYRPFDVIVIDDGSTDDTPERLAAYGDRIHRIVQPNRGVSAARNAGIAVANGEYLSFLDSDDLWEKNKLSAQMAFFRDHPEAVICQCEEIWIRNGKRVNPMNKHKKPSGMMFAPSLHLCLVSPSAVVIKRSLLEAVGVFDESLLACEDYDLWLRIGCRWPIYTTADRHVIKRGGHEDQLSRAPGLDRFRIQSIIHLLESRALTDDQAHQAREVLVDKCRIYAQGCRKRGKTDEADVYECLMEHHRSV